MLLLLVNVVAREVVVLAWCQSGLTPRRRPSGDLGAEGELEAGTITG